MKDHKRFGGVLFGILAEQLFTAKGWRVIAVTRDHRDHHRRVIVHLEPTRASAICSGCGETKKRIHDAKPARVTEDELDSLKEEIQDLTKKYEEKVEQHVKKKTTEILEI